MFGVSADQFPNDDQSKVVDIKDKELNEQLARISQLDEDEKMHSLKSLTPCSQQNA